jgi:N-methylhydantoinase A
MVDMHTIGAGGGSIAYLDSGGMLQVGPRSAGAMPGPVCYGQGGTEVTVTDAHVVLGRIDANASLAGNLRLDVAAATRAMETLAQAMGVDIKTADEGVLAVANEEIAAAIRLISVNRGFDPAQFRLTSFGGAGGLHVCALAEAMNMTRALVPANGGVLSALGMILARPGRQLSRTVTAPLAQLSDADIEQGLAALADQGRAELHAEGQAQACEAQPSVDLRYTGQSYTLNVPWRSREQASQEFVAQHKRRFGYVHDTELEIVNLRVKVAATGELPSYPKAGTADSAEEPHKGAVPSIERGQLGTVCHPGPLVITEPAATTYIAEGWQVQSDGIGNLDLVRIR